jgi:ABC-type multidrug transport system ATPase subunit
MENMMIELGNVRKIFGDGRVMNGGGFCLEKGFVYTLKGGNGSGKLTIGFCIANKGECV